MSDPTEKMLVTEGFAWDGGFLKVRGTQAKILAFKAAWNAELPVSGDGLVIHRTRDHSEHAEIIRARAVASGIDVPEGCTTQEAVHHVLRHIDGVPHHTRETPIHMLAKELGHPTPRSATFEEVAKMIADLKAVTPKLRV